METQQIEGYATLPPAFDPEFTKPHKPYYATHQMVFILARIKRRWKLPVAYYFTHQDSFSAASVVKELEIIVKKAKEVARVKIRGLANDQGPCNQGVWKELGIKLTRDASDPMNIKNYFNIASIILVRFVFTESDREPINELNDRLKVNFETKPKYQFFCTPPLYI